MDIFHNILLLTCPHIEPNTCFAKRHFLSSFGPKDVFYQSAFLVHVSTQRNIPPVTLLPFQREASSTSCPTSLVLPLSLLPLKCEVTSTAIKVRGELYRSSFPTSLVLPTSLLPYSMRGKLYQTCCPTSIVRPKSRLPFQREANSTSCPTSLVSTSIKMRGELYRHSSARRALPVQLPYLPCP